MRCLVVGVCTTLAVCLVLASSDLAAQKEKPKLTIKQVMVQAHKGEEKSLMRKVAAGTATRDDQAKLVALYVALSLNAPPRGSADDWKVRTTKLVDLAKKAEQGDEVAAQALVKAAACGTCHAKHKPK
jgi:hypothetical protein